MSEKSPGIVVDDKGREWKMKVVGGAGYHAYGHCERGDGLYDTACTRYGLDSPDEAKSEFRDLIGASHS